MSNSQYFYGHSPDAERAIALGIQMIMDNRHPPVLTDMHILWGLAASDRGKAPEILRSHQITAGDVLMAIKKKIGVQGKPVDRRPQIFLPENISVDLSAIAVADKAREIAQSSHARLVETEHQGLALIRLKRSARSILEKLDVVMLELEVELLQAASKK